MPCTCFVEYEKIGSAAADGAKRSLRHGNGNTGMTKYSMYIGIENMYLHPLD